MTVESDISETIRRSASEIGKLVSRFEEALAPTRSLMAQAQKSVSLFNALFKDVFAQAERDKKIAKQGWFPHPCLALDEIHAEIEAGSGEVDAFVRRQIENSWPEIRQSLEESEAFHELGGGHRETLCECVSAHEANLYRCVPRTLFGEIEMASRRALDGVQLNNKINASLKPVLAVLGDLPISLLPPEIRASVVYEVLTDHVYRDSRHQESGFPLPNRHDHIHGYSEQHATFQDSINMLFLADTMFKILAIFARLKREHSEEQAGDEGQSEC